MGVEVRIGTATGDRRRIIGDVGAAEQGGSLGNLKRDVAFQIDGSTQKCAAAERDDATAASLALIDRSLDGGRAESLAVRLGAERRGINDLRLRCGAQCCDRGQHGHTDQPSENLHAAIVKSDFCRADETLLLLLSRVQFSVRLLKSLPIIVVRVLLACG